MLKTASFQLEQNITTFRDIFYIIIIFNGNKFLFFPFKQYNYKEYKNTIGSKPGLKPGAAKTRGDNLTSCSTFL